MWRFTSWSMACCLLVAIGLSGCSTGLFGPTYRGYYVSSLTADPETAAPDEIVTIEVEYVDDRAPGGYPDLEPQVFIEVSAGVSPAIHLGIPPLIRRGGA